MLLIVDTSLCHSYIRGAITPLYYLHAASRCSLTADFEREVFGHHGEQVGRPVLTEEAYAQHCSKLTSVVGTLEQNIKTLLKDFDGKKKVCTRQNYEGREIVQFLFLGIASEPVA